MLDARTKQDLRRVQYASKNITRSELTDQTDLAMCGNNNSSKQPRQIRFEELCADSSAYQLFPSPELCFTFSTFCVSKVVGGCRYVLSAHLVSAVVSCAARVA